MSGQTGRPAEAGVSLVETIIAMTLLGVTLACLVPLTIGVARRSLRSGMETHSLGVVSGEVGRLAVAPYDSLPSTATCVADTLPPFPHQRCVTVSDLGTTRRVTMVITSTAPFFRPDTIVLLRSRPVPANPFNTS